MDQEELDEAMWKSLPQWRKDQLTGTAPLEPQKRMDGLDSLPDRIQIISCNMYELEWDHVGVSKQGEVYIRYESLPERIKQEIEGQV